MAAFDGSCKLLLAIRMDLLSGSMLLWVGILGGWLLLMLLSSKELLMLHWLSLHERWEWRLGMSGDLPTLHVMSSQLLRAHLP